MEAPSSGSTENVGVAFCHKVILYISILPGPNSSEEEGSVTKSFLSFLRKSEEVLGEYNNMLNASVSDRAR